MRAIIRAAFIAAVLLPAAVFAQQRVDGYQMNLGLAPDGTAHPLVLDSNYYLKVNCVTGCTGGGGGGTATQGAQAGSASGNTWFTQDVALDALISGGELPVSESTLDATISGGKMAISSTAGNSVGTTGATAFTVQGAAAGVPLPVSDTTQGVITPAAAPSSMHLVGCVYTSAGVTLTNGQSAAFYCASDNSLQVRAVGTSNVTVSAQSGAGGYSWAHAENSATSAMATLVKSAAGTTYAAKVCNGNASAVYFHLYNLSAAPTVGSTTGIVETDYIAPTSCMAINLADPGVAHSTGISYDVTAGSLADNDTTTITAANTVSVTVFYK